MIQGDEEVSQNDELWETAQNNEWYRWAAFTAREARRKKIACYAPNLH
ncbi:MAG: hypothetical protein ACRDB7_03530 [Fusobacteriaceae bacterium]